MPVQLRVYTIEPGALDAFAREWAAAIKPLRLALGFTVPAAWKIPETGQFVWLLAYEGPLDWDAADRAYHDSDARRAMDPDPARLIARTEQWFVEPVA